MWYLAQNNGVVVPDAKKKALFIQISMLFSSESFEYEPPAPPTPSFFFFFNRTMAPIRCIKNRIMQWLKGIHVKRV